jgi:hypothetical protein
MDAPVFKLCPGCNTHKSRFPLSNCKATRNGVKVYLKTRCSECHAHQASVAYHLRKIHPPPPPGTPCQCCGRAPPLLFLDHDHRTELFRGWLCRECNSGLGFLGDSAQGVAQALMYLTS